MKALYDHIGEGYDLTRKADPYLVSRLAYHLQADPQGNYADFGCGTGNYTRALLKKGLQFTGIDVSLKMLEIARQKAPAGSWCQADIRALPFEDGIFDGGMATLTVHHWQDLKEGFAEIARVLKGGPLILFTSLPEQMQGYWLTYYFPGMMQRSWEQMPSLDLLREAFKYAGLKEVTQEKYFVEPDLQDLFLYSGKFQPEVYFDETFRAGISSFRKLCNEEELQAGLARLKYHIENGSIDDIRRQYQNSKGDYLFIKLQS